MVPRAACGACDRHVGYGPRRLLPSDDSSPQIEVSGYNFSQLQAKYLAATPDFGRFEKRPRIDLSRLLVVAQMNTAKA